MGVPGRDLDGVLGRQRVERGAGRLRLQGKTTEDEFSPPTDAVETPSPPTPLLFLSPCRPASVSFLVDASLAAADGRTLQPDRALGALWSIFWRQWPR